MSLFPGRFVRALSRLTEKLFNKKEKILNKKTEALLKNASVFLYLLLLMRPAGLILQYL